MELSNCALKLRVILKWVKDSNGYAPGVVLKRQRKDELSDTTNSLTPIFGGTPSKFCIKDDKSQCNEAQKAGILAIGMRILFAYAFCLMAVLVLLGPSLLKIGIWIDFQARQGFIAENLCVNKSEPIKLCSGKCYLSKQLEMTDLDTEQEMPSILTEYPERTLDLPVSFTWSVASNKLDDISPIIHPERCSSALFLHKVFHPPRV